MEIKLALRQDVTIVKLTISRSNIERVPLRLVFYRISRRSLIVIRDGPGTVRRP